MDVEEVAVPPPAVILSAIRPLGEADGLIQASIVIASLTRSAGASGTCTKPVEPSSRKARPT